MIDALHLQGRLWQQCDTYTCIRIIHICWIGTLLFILIQNLHVCSENVSILKPFLLYVHLSMPETHLYYIFKCFNYYLRIKYMNMCLSTTVVLSIIQRFFTIVQT